MKKSFFGQFDSTPPRPSKAEAIGDALGIDRAQSLTVLSIDKIVPNPNQPRRRFSEEKLEELALSIRERGVLQPIRVREITTNAEYEIIAGERRWRAAKLAGLAELPVVIVRDQTRDQAYIDALIENVVREDLNPIERAEALTQIRVHLGALTWEEVAESGLIGLSRRQIFHLLGLTALPEPVQEDIRIGKLNEKHGRALRSLQKHPDQLSQLWLDIKDKGLSGDEALAVAKEIRTGSAADKPKVFKVIYRSAGDLIGALETKLDELYRDAANQPDDSEAEKVVITY